MFLVSGNNVFLISDSVLSLVNRIEDDLGVNVGEILERLTFHDLYQFRYEFGVAEDIGLASYISGLLSRVRGRF